MSDTEQQNYDDYESDLGLDEEDRKAAKSDTDIDWYKGVKGRTDRASIIYFHTVDVAAVNSARRSNPKLSKLELEEIGLKALVARATALSKAPDELTEVERLDLSEVHFKKTTHHFGGEGIGDVVSRMGKDGPDSDKVWKKLEEAKTHFATLLLIYPSNKDGELDKSQFASWAANPTLQPWNFSQKRYDAIWKVNNGLKKNNASIADQDLLLECKEDKYQQIETMADGKSLWLKSERLKLTVLTKAVKLYTKLTSKYRVMTTAQLREKLGLDEGGSKSSGHVSDVSGEEFQSLIDTV